MLLPRRQNDRSYTLYNLLPDTEYSIKIAALISLRNDHNVIVYEDSCLVTFKTAERYDIKKKIILS